MKKITGLFFGTALLLLCHTAWCQKGQPDFYQVKIYHLKNDSQLAQVDHYLQDAYLPALHRNGIKNIGVFKPLANDTAVQKLIYVLIPFSSPETWAKLDEHLLKDAVYITSSKSFREAPADKTPYERIESVLLEAFPGQPHMRIPASKSDTRVFELRSYESPTENLAAKKMAMFNTGGEIQIFNRLGFNPVFYARVVSGNRMPNFMYMPVFDNLQQKDAQWKIFGNDAQWKEVSSKPENENKVSVSHIDSIVMSSAPYSDY
jgi:NIPSNAP